MSALRSCVTLCLSPALQLQRTGQTEAAIRSALQHIPDTCQQPLLCAHRAEGCRSVNARYLRDLCTLRRLRDAAQAGAAIDRSHTP